MRSFDGRTAATGSLVATLVAVVVSSRFPAGVSLVMGLMLAGALMLMIDIALTRQRRKSSQRPDASARAAAGWIELLKLPFVGLRSTKLLVAAIRGDTSPLPPSAASPEAANISGNISKAQNAAAGPSAANDRDAEEYEDDI